jgi:gliding motility-associated lipoprotein GldB
MSFTALISCEGGYEHEEEINKIPMKVTVERFDREFAKATPADLPQLKNKYPLLFPRQTPDSIWIKKMNDSLQNELELEVKEQFPDFSGQKEKLKNLFQHFEFYLTEFEPPSKIITLISEVDYRNQIIATDSLLLISLDTYLGPDHEFYVGIQNFLRQNFTPKQIAPDVAEAYGEKLISKPSSRTLLAQMLYYGKLLYLKDKVLPKLSDAEKIGYKNEEMNWAENNEYQIWQHLVDRELLFSTRPDLQQDFLKPAPFTKFGLKLDNDSPPRLGQYIGWKILRAFADKNPEVSLAETLTLPADKIFKQSNYKPDKP